MMFKLLSPARFALAILRTAYARARGYRVLAEDVEQDARLYVCSSCSENNDGDCRICGCNLFAKTILTAEQCPLKKWRRIREKAVAVRR